MSSSSSFKPSKTSAFSPYSRYANKSMCIVPREWKAYPQYALNHVMQHNLTNHWKTYKKLEGAIVQIGDVTAKLEYNDERFWMKRNGDLRKNPHPDEYALTYVDKFYSPEK